MTDYRHRGLDNLVNHKWFPWLDLALVLIAGVMWSVGQGLLTWQPLLIALFPWLLRLIAGRYPFNRTPFDLPMLVFLISAGVGVWAAYNRPDAWAKFWILVAAILLFYALAGQPINNLWTVAGAIGFSGVLVGAYFLLTHDWYAFPAKFGPINNLMLGWMAIRPLTNLPALPPNVAASLMAISAPLLVAWGVHGWRGKRKTVVWVSLITSIILAAVLLLTTSRGAWIGLGVATGLVFLFLLSRPLAHRTSLSRRAIFGSLLIAAITLATVVIIMFPGGPLALLDRLPGPASGTSRFELSVATVNLIRDFPLTGGGLGSFPGLYSQYVLVIPFFFLPNGHNIFLDAALEQGPLGLVAMATIFIGSLILLGFRASSPQNDDSQDKFVIRLAVGISLTIMLVHGLVEDTVYGSQATLFLFALPGLTMVANLPQDQDVVGLGLQTRWVAGAMALFLVILGTVWFLTSGQSPTSTWQANLGAVRMAQAELADWPTNKWDDGSNVEALRPAEQLFKRSLASGGNRTAHYRLGLISMLRRNFGQAVIHLENASGSGGIHQGIDKNLAYSYVWTGRREDALGMMVSIPEAQDEMGAYARWWAEQGRDDLAGYANWAAIELNTSGRTSEISQ